MSEREFFLGPVSAMGPSPAQGIFSPGGISVTPPSNDGNLRGAHFSLTPAAGTISSPSTILQQRSILIRSSRLTANQARMDAVVSRMMNQLGAGKGLMVVVGGGVLVRTLSPAIQGLDLGAVTTVLSESPRWRWAVTTVPVVIAGCGSGGAFTDAGDAGSLPDSGGGGDATSVDNDGDGFPASIDCNDTNPNLHPLRDNELNVINTTRTICPGTYHGVRIYLSPSANGITVTGTGVNLDGTGVNEKGIFLNQADNNLIQGFTLYNYSMGGASVHVFRADGNTFQDMSVEAALERSAFFIEESANTTILRLECNSHSDIAVDARGSTAVTIRDSNFIAVAPLDTTPSYGLVTIDGGSGHWLENNLFRGGPRYGVELYNMTNATLLNNQVLNNISDGIYTSFFQNGRIESCQVNGNGGFGLKLNNTSIGNTVTMNNFTGNTAGPTSADLTSTPNVFTGNTPPP